MIDVEFEAFVPDRECGRLVPDGERVVLGNQGGTPSVAEAVRQHGHYLLVLAMSVGDPLMSYVWRFGPEGEIVWTDGRD